MSYLFYDLETSGLSRAFDQIFQFAAIRTDDDFNQIGEPIELFCKLRPDVIPGPHAIKVNQIDLRKLEDTGLCEFEFAREVDLVLRGEGNQCIVGYNSTSFDDEHIRFLFYRNLLSPYDWSWRDGNSCLDLYDVMCLGYSFGRLNGIRVNESAGKDSLKLENLAMFNGFEQEQAHDAVSDVKALIQLARKLRSESPKLLTYALGLRDKRKVRKIIRDGRLFFNSSSFNGYPNRFLSVNKYVIDHPTNGNSVIAWNLRHDPGLIFKMSADVVRNQMFAKKEDREIEIGFVEFKTNKRPMVTRKFEGAESMLPDYESCLGNLATFNAIKEKLATLATEVFSSEKPAKELDADLYAGDFFKAVEKDKRALNEFPSKLDPNVFTTTRFKRLAKRILARNFPDRLTETQIDRFIDWRDNDRLGENPPKGCLSWTGFKEQLEEVQSDPELTENQSNSLRVLVDFLTERFPDRLRSNGNY